MRKILTLFICAVTLILLPGPLLRAQYSEPQSAMSIPSGDLIQPQALKQMLDARKAPPIFQVGSHLFYTEAHIAGSKYAGPGSQQEGLQSLAQAVDHMPKTQLIVLYCGCCPWSHCPNVAPAWKHLHSLGYSNVKVLYLAHNFGQDWVALGYPTERQ